MVENGNGMVMPVSPYMGGGGGFGNGGFGGDWGWIILLLLLAGGGWGMGGFGGGMMGGMMGMDFGLYPWLNNSQNINDGFRDQMLHDNVTSIRDGVSNLSTQLCNCCGDMQMALANGFAGVEQGANARQIANMQTAFASQTAMAQGFNGVQSQLAECCCENRLATNDLKYTVATEANATRTANSQNTQAILDKLCQLELDGYKAQIEAKNDRIVDLQNQLNMASFRESQTAQNAFIAQGLNNEVDALYDRLSNCPVPSTPVYGRTPIFTCNNNNGCGCSGNNFYN